MSGFLGAAKAAYNMARGKQHATLQLQSAMKNLNILEAMWGIPINEWDKLKYYMDRTGAGKEFAVVIGNKDMQELRASGSSMEILPLERARQALALSSDSNASYTGGAWMFLGDRVSKVELTTWGLTAVPQLGTDTNPVYVSFIRRADLPEGTFRSNGSMGDTVVPISEEQKVLFVATFILAASTRHLLASIDEWNRAKDKNKSYTSPKPTGF